MKITIKTRNYENFIPVEPERIWEAQPGIKEFLKIMSKTKEGLIEWVAQKTEFDADSFYIESFYNEEDELETWAFIYVKGDTESKQVLLNFNEDDISVE